MTGLHDLDASRTAENGCAPVEEAAEVVAFWQDLGLPGLADVHTHFMPPNVLAKVWAFFDYPYLHQLQALARLDLGPAWLRAVCHDNAARVLGL